MKTPTVAQPEYRADAHRNDTVDRALDRASPCEPKNDRVSQISDEFAYANRCRSFRGKFWDETYAPALAVYARLAHHRNERVMAHAGKGQRLLDVGCGFGDLLYHLRGRFAELHGVDPSIDMVQHARDNMEQRGVASNCSISQALGEKLPFEEDWFDTVLMTDAYEHIHPPQRDAALREVRRVLRPGGRFVIVTPSARAIHAWAFMDNMLTIPRQIKAGKGVHIFSTTPKAYCEIFCSKRELLGDLKAARIGVQAFERVGFYPAPERPGFWEPYLHKLRKRQQAYDCVARSCRWIERLGLLNQKMLVRCSRSTRDRR
ncbi:MAG: class I SAM-dependent methyltransferase [Planctomycetes bacterium]|nr:class I SAM-dependent methyltransferase [Planctomycetota bacterium]